MANININVKVNQGSANARLKQLHGQVRKVGKATDDTARDFKNFNRTIFGATAFVGIFTQAFRGLADTMMAGSELDRAAEQFGKRFGSELPAQMQKFGDGAAAVVGPQGRFIQMIRSMTDNSIDMMAAMRASIQLRSSGVTGDINQMAEIVVRAGTAAKMAGKDSSEGIRRITDFLKDGSLAHLQHLGLLRAVNPELKAQLAILGSSAGVMGTAVTASFKLALGMKILRDATKGQLKGQRDLRDTLLDTAQFFDHLKRNVGTFLGTAMQPLLETFVDFAASASYVLEDIKNNKKEILFLAKAFIIGTAAVSAFVLVVGGLRLAVTALTSLVGGIPFLTFAFTALAGALLLNKTSLKGLIEGFRTFGAIAQGSFQLIHSFLGDPENYAAGIGKMDKSIHALLKKKGLLGLVKNLARVGAIVTTFAKGTIVGFTVAVDSMLDKLGSVGKRMKAFLGLDSGVWKRDWLETAKVLGEAFGKLAAGGIALWAAMKLFKGAKTLFTGGSAIAKFFGKEKVGALASATTTGGKGIGSRGSKTNPMYVIVTKDFLNKNQKSVYASLRKQGKSPADAIAGARAVPVGRTLNKKTGVLKSAPAVTKAAPKRGMMAGLMNLPLIGNLFGKKGGSAVKAAGTASKASKLGGLFSILSNAMKPVIGLFSKFGPFLGRILAGLGRFTLIGTVVAGVGTFLYGFIEGLTDARIGITRFVNAVGTWVSNLFQTNPFLSKIKTGFEFLYNGIADIFNKIREWGLTAGIAMGDMLGKVGQAMHDKNAAKFLKESRYQAGLSNVEPGTKMDFLLPENFMKTIGHSAFAPVVPTQPKSEIEQGSTIMQALSVVGESEKERMSKAFTEAISSDSVGGLSISKEEWEEIFAGGMDKSKKVDQLARSGDETKKNTGGTAIGSARTGVC